MNNDLTHNEVFSDVPEYFTEDEACAYLDITRHKFRDMGLDMTLYTKMYKRSVLKLIRKDIYGNKD